MSDLLELIPQHKKLLFQLPLLQWEKAVELVKQHQTVIVPAFYKRYDLQFTQAKEFILKNSTEEGTSIQTIEILMSYPGNPKIDNVEECINIEMIHDIDLLNYLIEDLDSEIKIEKVELSENNEVKITGNIILKKYYEEINFSIQYLRLKEGICHQKVKINNSREFGYTFEINENDGNDYWNCYSLSYKTMCKNFDNLPNQTFDGEKRIESFVKTMKLVDKCIDLSYDDDFVQNYNEKHNATLPLDKHIYKQFKGNIIMSDEGLLKPLKNQNEPKIFNFLQKTELKKYIPKYYGNIEINDSLFIQMSDLTENYTSPIVLDLKMGQTNSLSKMEEQPFGFKCVGTSSDPNKICYTWNDLFSSIKRYLKDNKENYCRYEVLPTFIKQLKEILSVIKELKGIQFKQVSLLLIYDALDNANQKPTVNICDFQKCVLDENNDEIDYYFCFGITSVINLLQSVHDYYTTRHCVFLCRHGFRLDYTDLTWVPNAKYPHDPPLSPEGIQQAKDLAKRLKHENLDIIVSSPFYRATQTAKFIAEELGIKYVVEPAFGEFLSINNRKQVPDLDPTPLQEDTNMDRSFTPLGGILSLETWDSMQERVHTSLNAITQKYHRVAIVSHRSTFQALLSVIVGHKFKYPLEFASVTSLVPSKRKAGFVIDRINMFSHLTVFTESPYYNPNYAAKNYTDMIINENGDVHDS